MSSEQTPTPSRVVAGAAPVSTSEILRAVESAEEAERDGDHQKASSLYGNAIRLVRRRYEQAGNSPVSVGELKRRQAATAQGVDSTGGNE